MELGFDLYLMGFGGQGIVYVLNSKPVKSQVLGVVQRSWCWLTAQHHLGALQRSLGPYSAGDSEFREGVGRARMVEMAMGWRFFSGFHGEGERAREDGPR